MRNLEQKTHGAREKGKLLGAGGASTTSPQRHGTKKEIPLSRWFRKKISLLLQYLAQDFKNWYMFNKYMSINLKPSRKS